MERTHLIIHPFQSSASIHVSFPVCTRNIFSTSRSVYATMIEPCRLFDMFSGSTDCNGVLLLFFNLYLLDIICTIFLHSKLVSTLSKWELAAHLLGGTIVVAITLRYLMLVFHCGGLVKSYLYYILSS